MIDTLLIRPGISWTYKGNDGTAQTQSHTLEEEGESYRKALQTFGQPRRMRNKKPWK